MGKQLIEARILKGFRDSLPHGPQGEKRRKRIIAKLEEVFELGGFDPIDTPALELCEILLGKAGGETEKQVYRFQDNGGRDVALRFDLTVPFSRFVVQHAQELHFPFKRYHIAKVWRGENAQRGRYREFFQCDFDIVGDSSNLANLCVLQMAHTALSILQQGYPALGKLRIHINHRGLFSAFAEFCEIQEEQRSAVLCCIDKLSKIGKDALYKELLLLLGQKSTEILLHYLGLSGQKMAGFQAELERIKQLLQQWFGGPKKLAVEPKAKKALSALAELQQIAEFAQQHNMNLHLDSSIIRGLDYYTGMVFETFLEDLPYLGSVCSGGSYEQLTQLYSKLPMPGVGGSIGLDRLLAGLEELEQRSRQSQTDLPPAASYQANYVIASTDPEWKMSAEEAEYSEEELHKLQYSAQLQCLELARVLQLNGIACDVVPRPQKMNALFQRAESKNCRYLAVLKPDFSWRLRDLQERQSTAYINAVELSRALQALQS